jgi:RimJ/RimL family protein N-acetyltransferase
MLETTDLIMTKIVEDDLDMYFKMYKCPQTTKYLPNGKPYSDVQIKDLVKGRIEHWGYGFGTFTILKKSTSKKIGYVGIERSPNPAFSDIRYGIDVSNMGNGYAVTAALECLRFTFDLGLHKKVFGASVCKNLASLRVLQKLGMEMEPNIDLYETKGLLYLSLSKTVFYKAFNRSKS